jgi:hypothetical protein
MKLERLKKILLVCIVTSTLHATENPYGYDLAKCLIDSTSQEARINLAKWVYLGMSKHPELKDYAAGISKKDIAKSNIFIAEYMTDLVLNKCKKEFINAGKYDKSAIEDSFKVLGQIAMTDLMSNQNVYKHFNQDFLEYFDVEQITKELGEN